jgi:hypothetical protein
MQAKVCRVGVDGRAQITLKNTENTAEVFWSPQRYREEEGRQVPAGGCNSYVLIADKDGSFQLGDERVDLVSINGAGEERWRVKNGFGEADAAEAIQHFGLVKAPR